METRIEPNFPFLIGAEGHCGIQSQNMGITGIRTYVLFCFHYETPAFSPVDTCRSSTYFTKINNRDNAHGAENTRLEFRKFRFIKIGISDAMGNI